VILHPNPTSEAVSGRGISRRLSLRARPLLLVLAGVVPLIGFSLGSEYLQYRQAIAATGRQTLDLARSMSLLVEQELRTRMVTLEVLAASPALQQNDIAAFRAQAETVIAEQFRGSNLILLRSDGQQLMNTLLPPGAALPVRPDMEVTREVLATGRPMVSNFYIGAIGPRPVVAIDVPVRRPDGSVAYVLSTNPRLEDFDAIIRRQQLPASWIISIFDRRGINVARRPSPERFVGSRAGADLYGRMMAQGEDVFQNVSREGIGLVSAFSHSAQFGWAVAVGVPRAELIGPAVDAALRTLAAGSLLVALAIALALLVARQITSPIAALRRLAAAGDGEAVLAAPPTGLREADEVLGALRIAEANRRASEHARELARAALDESEEKLRQSQKMEAVGQLTGGLAHDFNNLLLIITGNLETLLESPKLAAEEQEIARDALTAAQRGADLGRSLLAFARRQPLQPRPIDVNDLVRHRAAAQPHPRRPDRRRARSRRQCLARDRRSGAARGRPHQPRDQCPRCDADRRPPDVCDRKRRA
jgi:signal transduction histidine kinase